jgi:HJR/Mrr/RecB family endonuclease
MHRKWHHHATNGGDMSETNNRIGHFIDNGDGTVTDTRTCLMWMRCAMGQKWKGKACQGNPREYTWNEAKKCHTFARYTDWRLPDINELKTLIDKSQGTPAIDSNTFINISQRSFFWSSSKNYARGKNVNIIDFSDGSESGYLDHQDWRCFVRLVRDGQIQLSFPKNASKKYSFAVTQSKSGATAQILELPGVSVHASTPPEAMEAAEYLANIVEILYELCIEAEKLTKPFAHIDYSVYPEFRITEFGGEIEKFDNYLNKFFKEIAKVIKNGKSIIALEMLSRVFEQIRHLLYIKSSESLYRAVTQFVNLFMEAFIQLGRFDILIKYYKKDQKLSHNLNFLQHIVEYYISIRDADNASAALENLLALEPSHPFVAQSHQKIKTISMIKRLGESNIDMEKIDSLSGQDFESILIQQFIKIGFTAQGTPASGDFGADIIVDADDGTRFIIQCKRFKNKVNLKAVQEVVGALAHYNGDIGIVITSNGFLSSAATLAESNGIELWSKMELMKFLSGDLSFSQITEWKK